MGGSTNPDAFGASEPWESWRALDPSRKRKSQYSKTFWWYPPPHTHWMLQAGLHRYYATRPPPHTRHPRLVSTLSSFPPVIISLLINLDPLIQSSTNQNGQTKLNLYPCYSKVSSGTHDLVSTWGTVLPLFLIPGVLIQNPRFSRILLGFSCTGKSCKPVKDSR